MFVPSVVVPTLIPCKSTVLYYKTKTLEFGACVLQKLVSQGNFPKVLVRLRAPTRGLRGGAFQNARSLMSAAPKVQRGLKVCPSTLITSLSGLSALPFTLSCRWQVSLAAPK